MGPTSGTVSAQDDPTVWGTPAFITRDQFVYYLTLARQKHDPADWPTFRIALVAALTAAWGLDTRWTDLDPDDQQTQVDERRRRAFDLVDAVRTRHDPLCDWDRFFDALWDGRHPLREPL